MNEMRGVVWIEGRLVAASEACVPVFDRGFLYGDSVYEVLRTVRGAPFALEEHLDRLAGSARRLALSPPPREKIREAALAAIAALGGEAYVRIIVTRGSGPISLDPALADGPRLVIICKPLELPDDVLYREGATVALVGARRNAVGAVDPQVKSGNYLTSVLAVAEGRSKGAYEAVMCDAAGRIAEGASSNFFIVRGGRVATPPLAIGILDGITRRHVIALARELGLWVDEVGLWPMELRRAEEAFLTSSVRGVMPVCRVDGEVVGAGHPGPWTQRLMAAYQALLER